MVYKFKTSCFYSDLKKEWQKYCVDGKGIFTLEEEIHVEDIKGWLAPDGYTVLRATVLPPIVHMSCESSKIELPNLKDLKGIDDNLKRHLLTYIQTKELNSLSGNYHDDILKRWFLILEEIEEDTGNMDYQNIKRARHFVSHSICDTKSGRKVIDFLKRELRASVYQDCEKKEVACFDRRNADHILFVEKYARIAEDRVKMLLESML
ncbi:MAG: hypothetical protein D3922_15205 [Candidatus Electrothrix sp. AR1]|nr:hypothetical protein [Candidatus Electrothrix sp. AR1]